MPMGRIWAEKSPKVANSDHRYLQSQTWQQTTTSEIVEKSPATSSHGCKTNHQQLLHTEGGKQRSEKQFRTPTKVPKNLNADETFPKGKQYSPLHRTFSLRKSLPTPTHTHIHTHKQDKRPNNICPGTLVSVRLAPSKAPSRPLLRFANQQRGPPGRSPETPNPLQHTAQRLSGRKPTAKPTTERAGGGTGAQRSLGAPTRPAATGQATTVAHRHERTCQMPSAQPP